jgi:hypothetical protein
VAPVPAAHAVERVLLLELRQELRQLGVVPLGELVGAVVGDGERDGGQVVAVEPPNRHLGHAEFLGGLEPGVTGDYFTGTARDNGLLPAEAAQAGRDVGDGGVVAARVGGGAEELGDRNGLDRRGSILRQGGTSGRWEPLGGALGWVARRGSVARVSSGGRAGSPFSMP